MVSSLPSLPLTCLKTAKLTNTINAFHGKPTVIDFWTTRCTQCPDALDQLDTLASQSDYQNVHFVSICCDRCDGAREILEEKDELRWNNIHHYYMDPESKEVAKKQLGFQQVPFYVILNDRGEIVQKGSKKQIDLDNVPGRVVMKKPVVSSPTAVNWEFTLDEDF
mmetsp:Transcript_11620/g.16709  ORF Transcript_11620/g.16709 Transcript_11620/m.16709 type:complete len:165 (-) Transcript_11620:72-566(-)